MENVKNLWKIVRNIMENFEKFYGNFLKNLWKVSRKLIENVDKLYGKV